MWTYFIRVFFRIKIVERHICTPCKSEKVRRRRVEMENNHHVIMFDSLFDNFFVTSFFLSPLLWFFVWLKKKTISRENVCTPLTDDSLRFRISLPRKHFFAIEFYLLGLTFMHTKRLKLTWIELDWIESDSKIKSSFKNSTYLL